ncbi:MAG: SH3 domain-containing protein [Saprospiraceae bacterium]|nr:SH3 domain-containing protein [Saprospiraceae bacterium]
MPHFDWKILPLLLLLTGCKNKQSPEYQIIVSAEQASLRAEPSEKSREIATLRRHETLADLGEVSSFESQIIVGEHFYQTPWIKVKTADDQEGWVHASALRPVREQSDWLLQKRLICYFGKNLSMRRNTLYKKFKNVETEGQLLDFWQESVTLRDTFLVLLSQRPESGFQPQFNWLNEVLPGFIYQKIGAGSQPHLFADFGKWQQKVLKTNGLQDNIFIETCLAAFPTDSIESFFPVWKFQLSESESASQLGTGQHLRMLTQIHQALASGSLFAPQLLVIKDQILEDIFGKNQRYWQPQEKILEELGQIIANPPKCLSAPEREAFSIRQKMFEDPGGNGIVVNLRSGE